MKVITYTSHGGNVPDAVKDYVEKHGVASRADKDLVAFVEHFYSKAHLDANQFHTCQAKAPHDLFFYERTCHDGITRNVYYGYCSVTRTGVQVTVNEYDETACKVTIETYDGKECLVQLPVYEPVDGIPGLFERRHG